MTIGAVGGTLIVWKAPAVADERQAAALLEDYHATGDESAFTRDPAVERFLDEILARWPALESHDPEDPEPPPTWSSTPGRSDRVVALDYSWSAPDELLDDVERLAREHGLVLYDPQGPDVHLPDDPPDEEFVPDAREVARVTAIGVAAVVVGVIAWLVSITVLSWIVIVVAAFVALMAASTLVVYARDARRRA